MVPSIYFNQKKIKKQLKQKLNLDVIEKSTNNWCGKPMLKF